MSSKESQQTFSPIDGRLVCEFELMGPAQVTATLSRAKLAQSDWKRTSIEDRIAVVEEFVRRMEAEKERLAIELTLQMGRPIRYAGGEISTMGMRALQMASMASTALAAYDLPKEGFKRRIVREPLGVVLAIAPWNYPYLTAINVVVPALLAGNSVVLKPSPHTPMTGESIAEAFAQAGLPEGLLQVAHLNAQGTESLVNSAGIDYVAFTGSVEVGRKVQRAASQRFVGVGLELGGKDPAYIRADADLEFAAENVMDGAFFNSGQSCCAIERVYVHESAFEEFVARSLRVAQGLVLGDPLDPETTLGPMIRMDSADYVRSQTSEAVSKGAQCLVDESMFPGAQAGGLYLAPQILTGVDHSMSLMRDESFGPVVGVMPVKSDEEAIRLMNDSRFGLTASIWTSDPEAAESLGEELETGTVFMNRCDYLDPELPWVGVKDSGRGCTLSHLGFSYLTRPKSFHFRVKL